ncbi:MAG TPA: glycosyl hydrolase, partial [Bacteroidales bacterium]|nr:glycosyl hydrolase [Bacteroidales bacterium]
MKNLICLLFLLTHALNAQQLPWPGVERETRPWTRWWWPGNIVNPDDISSNLDTYKKAGLGGVEITPIYGVKGYEEKFIDYLSPEWMEMFIHTLKEAERLDMGVDLANASGWPFGGPWVDPEEACRNINYKTYSLAGGEKLNEKIEFIQQPLVRPVGVRPDISKLNDPISKNENLQLYALDQIRFEKPVPLQALITYSDKGDFADLTGKVTTEGELDWIAPEGNWTIWALFQGWHGKMVERAGPGGEGDVIDHFSGRAIDNYLRHFETVMDGYDISTL